MKTGKLKLRMDRVTMKRIACIGCLSLAWLAGGSAAPVGMFLNDTILTAPPDTLPTINATSFVNRSSFTVYPGAILLTSGGGVVVSTFLGASFLPYETFNTRYFTNEASGFMYGSPGFRFLTTKFVKNSKTRVPADWFVNDGQIQASTYLEVKATNIVCTGPMDVGASGLIRLAGRNNCK